MSRAGRRCLTLSYHHHHHHNSGRAAFYPSVSRRESPTCPLSFVFCPQSAGRPHAVRWTFLFESSGVGDKHLAGHALISRQNCAGGCAGVVFCLKLIQCLYTIHVWHHICLIALETMGAYRQHNVSRRHVVSCDLTCSLNFTRALQTSF